MAKTYLGTDPYQRRDGLERLQKWIPEFNEVLEAYKVLGLEDLSSAEFQPLLQSPKFVVFDKMTGGQPVSIAGLKVNKAKAMDILDKPDGYDELLELIEKYKVEKSQFVNQASLVEIVDGAVVPKQSAIDKAEEDAKRYAETSAQLKRLAFGQAVIAALQEIYGDNWTKVHPIELIGECVSYNVPNQPSMFIKTPEQGAVLNVNGIVHGGSNSERWG